MPPCRPCGANVTQGERRYDCIWRAGGKQYWKTFNNAHDAKRHLNQAVRESHEGTYVHVRPIQMNDLFDRWLTHSLDVRLKQGKLKPSTVKSYKSMLRTHLREAFKDFRSDRLSARVIGEWERKIADAIAEGDLTAKSFNHLVALLHSILKWGRMSGQRYLAHDPLVDVARLQTPRTEARFLEPDEVQVLLKAAEGQEPAELIINVALHTGVRRSELFALRWSDLDEDAHQLRIRQSIYQGEVSERPKTKKSVRSINLSPTLVGLFQDYRKRYPPMQGDYIFRTDKGTPIDADNWMKRWFVPIAVSAGLRFDDLGGRDNGRQMGLHALRHTFASLLLNQGASLQYVCEQMGHASINITVDIYGHLFKETRTVETNRLSMRLFALAPDSLLKRATGTEG